MIPRWYGLGVAIIGAQVIWVVALCMALTPLHAIVAVIGLVAAIAILLIPQYGVLLLSALLIGQWPANLITYLGLLTLASTLAWLLLHQKQLLPKSAILYLSGCYFLIALLSLISSKTNIDVRSHVLALAGHCSFVWLFATLVTTRQLLLNVLRLMVASGVVTALIGLVQWRTHFVWIASTTRDALTFGKGPQLEKTAFELQGWQGQFRIDSITGTPDFLPLYMQCLSPFVALWIVQQKTWGRRLAGIAVLGLFAVAHVLSFTRGALITTAGVAVLVAWSIDRKRTIAYAPLAGLCLFLVMLSWAPLRGRLLSMFELAKNESIETVNTGGWRLRTIPVALKMISERPILGLGLGQQRWNWPESSIGDLIPDPRIVEPLPLHNDYLLVPVEIGIGGVVVLLLFIVVSIRQLHQAAVYFKARDDLELAIAAQGTLLAIAGLAMAMAFYPIVDNFRYFWLLLAVAAALLCIRADMQRGDSADSRAAIN
jgi:hypothetical protein